MKLYSNQFAPNPRRVRMFVAEKGIEIPVVEVDISKKEHKTPEFFQKNPMGMLPVLELDDGSYLSESVAICRYLEEIHPEPRLMGADARDKAFIEMWNRRMELEIMAPIAQVFRNTHPFWQGRIPQSPEYGEICRNAAVKRLEWLNEELAEREFIAGDRYTIADITALVGIEFGKVSKIRIAEEHKNLLRWHTTVTARPSAKA